jgi:anti-anti-sigma factor
LVENPVGPRATLIQVVGELDATVVEDLIAASRRLPIEHDTVVLGLDECEFVDSTGIAAILQIQGELTAADRALCLCAPRGAVRRTLDLVGVLAQTEVLESLDELPA